MSRGALTIVFVVCACAAATARASPWEGMAESNHRRCTKLADDVSKLGDAREVPRALQQARA
ncbi:MAG: hypothetical protein JWM53_5321, partial [bacterium]|nr:hypothetical protein [bacterium]